jgi:hypothetical protein
MCYAALSELNFATRQKSGARLPIGNFATCTAVQSVPVPATIAACWQSLAAESKAFASAFQPACAKAAAVRLILECCAWLESPLMPLLDLVQGNRRATHDEWRLYSVCSSNRP